jgi:hypothetical protein
MLASEYITKNSFNNEIHDNDIETVGIGLVATSNSINNVFHSNTVTDAKNQTTLQDSTSNEIIFKTIIKNSKF